MPKKINPVLLIILDGWGVAPPSPGNAVTLAHIPTFWSLKNKYSYTELCASGKCVGLPQKQGGNSEAGHLNLGAGRVIKDDAVFVSEAIKDGTFFKNPIFLEGLNYYQKHHSQVHLMGLITEEQSAHSSPEHWLAMLNFLNQQHVSKVYLHLFTDGRDSAQHAAIKIIQRFEARLKNNHNHGHRFQVQIASICGRFYAMDRIKHWDRIEKAYNLLVLGEGLRANSAEEAIVQAYNRRETDEFISPTVIYQNNKPAATIDNHDLVVFMNLRSDRARELTKVFTQIEFNKKNIGSFHRKRWPDKCFFIALTDFGPDLDLVRTAFPSRVIVDTLPMVMKNYRQLYIAEEEKFAHVSFFFNGGYDHPVANEARVAIPSPIVASYDQRPEMAAEAITQYVLDNLSKNDFIVINFANPDMVAHTGNLAATIRGLEVVDQCLSKIINKTLALEGRAIITADHGNAEEMINLQTGEIDTKHSINPVPFILIDQTKPRLRLKEEGALADVAPTILDMFDLFPSSVMRGKSLLSH